MIISSILVDIVFMMTSPNGNIFRVTGPLCGEFTGPGEFPTQRPVTRSFDVFFDLPLNKRLSKQPWGWWFETPSWSLLRQCNEIMVFLDLGVAFDTIDGTNVLQILGTLFRNRGDAVEWFSFHWSMHIVPLWSRFSHNIFLLCNGVPLWNQCYSTYTASRDKIAQIDGKLVFTSECQSWISISATQYTHGSK